MGASKIPFTLQCWLFCLLFCLNSLPLALHLLESQHPTDGNQEFRMCLGMSGRHGAVCLNTQHPSALQKQDELSSRLRSFCLCFLCKSPQISKPTSTRTALLAQVCEVKAQKRISSLILCTCSFYEKNNSFFSCFWGESGIAGERSKPIFLFLFQNWEAKLDCEMKGWPPKRSRVSEALATALRPSKKCLIQ